MNPEDLEKEILDKWPNCVMTPANLKAYNEYLKSLDEKVFDHIKYTTWDEDFRYHVREDKK